MTELARGAGAPDPSAIPAATVVLARDRDDGLEVLMLRKNAQLAFGGMWVFPGGRVDADDGDGEEGARRAAAREAREEADLLVEPNDMVPFAHWTPPAAAPKRFATWFFLAPAPSGDVSIDGGEIHDHVWVSPDTAMVRHAAGEIELAPPTWITLRWLQQSRDLAAALDLARANPMEIYETHIARGSDGALAAVWLGDAGYESGDLEAPGARHRLWMRDGGWVFERST